MVLTANQPAEVQKQNLPSSAAMERTAVPELIGYVVVVDAEERL